MKYVLPLVLLLAVGCGTTKQKSTTTPPQSFTTMAGSWNVSVPTQPVSANFITSVLCSSNSLPSPSGCWQLDTSVQVDWPDGASICPGASGQVPHINQFVIGQNQNQLSFVLSASYATASDGPSIWLYGPAQTSSTLANMSGTWTIAHPAATCVMIAGNWNGLHVN